MHTTFINMTVRINICVSMKGAQRKVQKLVHGYKTHEGNKKKWQCTTCLAHFMYASQLLRHEDTHKDLKPYKCPSKYCRKFTEGFKSQQALNHHMYIHRGVQIPCTVAGCSKTSPTKSYLKEHLNTKHGPGYECKNIVGGCTFKCRS